VRRSLALALALMPASTVAAAALPATLSSRTDAQAMRHPGQDLASTLDEGRALLAAANPVQAMAAFNAALALDPDNLAAINGLGIAYDRLGRADLARQQFERALSIAPDAADIAYNLGLSLMNAGLHRAAIAPLQQAVAGDDARAAASARRLLAIINMQLAQPEPAAPPATAPPRQAAARIDLVASGEAVLVLAEAPRRTPAAPAAPSAVALASGSATSATTNQDLTERLGDAAALTRPPEPVTAPLPALAQRAAPAATILPATPPQPQRQPLPPHRPMPATSQDPLPALQKRLAHAAQLQQAAILPADAASPRRPRQTPPEHRHPLPDPVDPVRDIRLAIARLERLLALIEVARG